MADLFHVNLPAPQVTNPDVQPWAPSRFMSAEQIHPALRVRLPFRTPEWDRIETSDASNGGNSIPVFLCRFPNALPSPDNPVRGSSTTNYAVSSPQCTRTQWAVKHP
jgi:hypothetical protein